MATFKQFVTDTKNFLNSDAGQVVKNTAILGGYYVAGMALTKKFNPGKATFGNAVVSGLLNVAAVGAIGAIGTWAANEEASMYRNLYHQECDARQKAEDKIIAMKREMREAHEEENLPETAQFADFMEKLREAAV